MTSMYSSFSSRKFKVNGLSPLDRRTPRNPKYSGIKSNLDTGASMSKVQTISTREYLKRRNEIFKRVTIRTVAELLEEYNREEKTESIFHMGSADDMDSASVAAAKLSSRTPERSQAASSQLAGEEISSVLGSPRAPTLVSVNAVSDRRSRPYLLLDLRERVEFDQCHLKTAVSYPAQRLRHDKITPDLFWFKNRESHVIVIYGGEEREAAEVATMMVEKGWENIFMMSGGLYKFGLRHKSLCVGVVPEPPQRSQPTRRGRRGGRRSRDKSSGRPPLASRGNSSAGARLTSENLRAVDRSFKSASPRRHAPSIADSTMSRTESLLSWNMNKQ